jgi:hypothetical protein
VVGPVEAVADHHLVVLGGREEQFDLTRVELAVAVGEEHPRVACRREPRTQRAAVAEVALVMDGAYLSVGRGHRVGDAGGAVGRTVVDDDHLEALEVKRAQRVERSRHGRLDARFLVVRREEDAQLTDRHWDPERS